MADSRGAEDRDDAVHGPQEQGKNLPDVDRDGVVPDPQPPQEPDRGITPWQVWARLAIELVIQLLNLINGSGG